MRTPDDDSMAPFARGEDGQFSSDVLAHELESFGTRYADLSAAAKLLEKTQPAVLAKLTVEVMAQDAKLTRKAAQDLAEGSDAYLGHVRAAVEAARKAKIAMVRYDAVRSFARTIQTEEANKRATRDYYTNHR